MDDDQGTLEKREIKVSALVQGTVIDHLRAGSGLRVLKVLGLTGSRARESAVAIGLNLDSGKLGHKDLIKIESRELTPDEVNKIALLSPEATLSIIRDYQVVRKFQPELTEALEDVIRCGNPSCISNQERIASLFQVVERRPLRVRCHYCERAVPGSEIDLR